MTDHISDAVKKVREDFEAWHAAGKVQPLERYLDTYKNAHTRCRWEGYQAATQHSAARIAELDAQVQAISLDADRYQFATAYNDEGRLNFKSIYDAWDGDGSFTDQIDAARATHKEQT